MFGFGKSSNEASPGSDAISILTADHRKVDGLFAEFEAAERGSRKIAIATQIVNELVVHATAEEDLFYPQALAVLEDEESKGLIWEATVEHGTLEGLIDSLSGMSADDDSFDAHVKVLKEYVKHHVKEEENEIFPRIRATGIDLEELGRQIAERKEALKEAMARERNGGRGAPRGGASRGSQSRSSGGARGGREGSSESSKGGGRQSASGGGRRNAGRGAGARGG